MSQGGAEDQARVAAKVGAPPPEQHDLRSLLAAGRRQLPVILLTLALGMGAALLYLFLATPQYTASARLMIDTRGGKILDANEVMPALNADIATIESQVEVLRSRRIAERVRTGLAIVPAGGVAPPAAKGDEDARLRRLMQATTVERQGLSFVVDVGYRAPDREAAAKAANALVDAFLADQIDVKRQATMAASERLKARVAESGVELRGIEKRIQKYLATNGSFESGELQHNRYVISEKMQELGGARTKVAGLKAALERLKELAAAPDDLARVDETNLPDSIVVLRRRLIETQAKVDGLVARLGDRHQQVRDARVELAAVKRDAALEIDRLMRQIGADAETSDRQLKALEGELERLWRNHAARSLSALGLAELEREAEATRQLHAALLKRLKETEAQQDLQAPDARVIAYATPPLSPSYPRIPLTLAAAFFGSLLVGSAAALIRENFA